MQTWYEISVKTARSCTVSTRRVMVFGMHTWHLPMLMVVRVRSQTRQLPTCLWHNLIILTQDVMRNVSTSSKRRLLTCVDTIWQDVIHAKTVGMCLHNARAIKSLESTVMSVKVVMKMCFLQNLVVFARILQNHKTNTLLGSYTVFRDKFCPLFRPIYVFSIYMDILWKSSFIFYKGLHLEWSDIRHLCFFCSKHLSPKTVKFLVLWLDAHNMKSPYQCPRRDLHFCLCFRRKNWHYKSTICRDGCIQHTELCVRIPLISTFSPS